MTTRKALLSPIERARVAGGVLTASAAMAIAGASGVACSSAPEEPPPLLESNSTARSDGGSRGEAPSSPPLVATAGANLPGAPEHDGGPIDVDVVPDASLESRSWAGSLARATPVTFGGAPHCSYRITLEKITATITATKSGAVTAATVTAMAVEEALAPCTYPPIPPHLQTYNLASSTPLANGSVRIELAPASVNRPRASLVLDVDLGEAFPEASLAWHRIDIAPPLDWRVDVKLTVAPM